MKYQKKPESAVNAHQIPQPDGVHYINMFQQWTRDVGCPVTAEFEGNIYISKAMDGDELSKNGLEVAKPSDWVVETGPGNFTVYSNENFHRLFEPKNTHDEDKAAYAGLEAQITAANIRAGSLQAFKDYVHQRLDDAGVTVDPESPHKAAGCRIGGRLDEVLGKLATLSSRVAELETVPMAKQETKSKRHLSAAEALYAFIGWLSTQEHPFTISARHEVGAWAELISQFCESQRLDEPRLGWSARVLPCPSTDSVAKTQMDKLKPSS